MIGIIDTCSLVAIARYYLSIKDGNKLLSFLEHKFRSGDLILLSSIHREARYTHSGIVITAMPFLDDKELIMNDKNLIPSAPKKFSNLLDNNFCIAVQRKKLTNEAYAQQKEAYMSSGDIKLILYALNNIEQEPIIITEETKISNDGKLFKKIPAICEFFDLKCMTVTQWLASNDVELSWAHPTLE